MKIGIIGAGRVGCSIGKYFQTRSTQCQLIGYYNRTYEKACMAADFTGSKAFTQLHALIEASDTLMIATSDSQISHVWDCIDKQTISNKIICHFSGSLSSDVFSGIEQTGAFPGSIHPMYTFSDRFHSYTKLNHCSFTLEGHNTFLFVMGNFLKDCGNKIHTIHKSQKNTYHASASMASNHLLGLYNLCLALMERSGFSRQDSYEIIGSLMIQTLSSAMENGVTNTLTGPIERNDLGTINGHINILNNREQLLYSQLGLLVTEIAKHKHPQQDYTMLERILTYETNHNHL